MEANEFDWRDGKVVYWELDRLRESEPIELQREELKEDLAQVEFGSEIVLDIGWYPEFSLDGKFVVSVVCCGEWDAPVFRVECKQLSHLNVAIRSAVRVAGCGGAEVSENAAARCAMAPEDWRLQHGDELFKKTKAKDALYADLDWPPNGHLIRSITGYRELAVSSLRAGVEKGFGHEVDRIIRPVVFLFRHYVELQLKKLVSEFRSIDGAPFPPKKLHPLTDLWSEVVRRTMKHFPETEIQQLEAAEALIRELDALDDRSATFRYPDEQERIEHFRRLDCRNLLDVMERLGAFLDYLDAGPDVLR